MKPLHSGTRTPWRRLRNVIVSVRFRLTLWYVAVLALVLVSFSVGVYMFLVNRIDAEVADTIASAQQSLTKQAQANKPPQLGRITLKGSTVAGLTLAYQNETGKTVVVGNLQGQKSISDALESTLLTLHGGCTKVQGDTLKCQWPVFSPGKDPVPIAAVGLQGSLEPVTHAEAVLRTALVVGVPFCLLIALVGGWALASRALSPVEELRRTAQSITATDLSRRIAMNRNDEMGRLAATLDDMIQRLDTAFREQRQLAADVSHELRTPLAVIQAQTSLALRRERSPREYETVLTSIQEETDRMSRIVADLLLLARAEVGQETIIRGPVRLDQVARWGVEQTRNVAEAKGVSLRCSTHPAMTEGDEDRLRQLVLNLLDNAIKYTPPRGTVVVSVQSTGGEAILRVADTGEGIPADSLPHIFQRFYRADRARPRGEGSSGLGLAIARWVVDAHGGQIDVKSEVGKGSVFTIRLPALTPERAALTA